MLLLKKFAFLVVILSVLPYNSICNENDDDHDDDKNDLEDEMELRMERDGQRVTLRLKENDNVRDDVPVFASKDNVMRKLNAMEIPRFKTYQDMENMASILVAQENDNAKTRSLKARSYRGTFNLRGRQYILRPITRALPPVRKTRGTGPAIRTMDLGDVTEMSHETEHQLREAVDDSRIKQKLKNLQRNIDVRKRQQQPTNVFYVEMAIFIDYSLYRRFVEDANGNERYAKSNATFYFSHVANGVNMRYKTINDPDIGIHVKLVAIHIAEDIIDSNYTEGADVMEIEDGIKYSKLEESLEYFFTYIDKNLTNGFPQFDHATLFTGNVLFNGRDAKGNRNLRLGLSYSGNVCTYYKASINRDKGQYSSTQTAAHELGHNLGIEKHDGQDTEGANCPTSDQYVMAQNPTDLTPNNFDNPFQFSSCSIDQLKGYLLNSSRWWFKNNCLLNQANNAQEVEDSLALKQPGQEFTPDEQCQHIYGPTSYYCGRGSPDENICSKMYCYMPKHNNCSTEAELRAFNGTSCGDKKWCVRGACVRDTNAPTKDYCIYGEYEGPILHHTNETCKNLVQGYTWKCGRTFESGFCCESCPCNDKDQSCAQEVTNKPNKCYQSETMSTCCKTCYAHRFRPPGCEFGNKDEHFCSTTKVDCKNVDHKEKCCMKCDTN